MWGVAELHPDYFDSVYRSMIAAGESAGNLVPMLDRLAALIRRRLHVRTTVIGALVYPILVLNLICTLRFILPEYFSILSR